MDGGLDNQQKRFSFFGVYKKICFYEGTTLNVLYKRYIIYFSKYVSSLSVMY